MHKFIKLCENAELKKYFLFKLNLLQIPKKLIDLMKVMFSFSLEVLLFQQ